MLYACQARLLKLVQATVECTSDSSSIIEYAVSAL